MIKSDGLIVTLNCFNEYLLFRSNLEKKSYDYYINFSKDSKIGNATFLEIVPRSVYLRGNKFVDSDAKSVFFVHCTDMMHYFRDVVQYFFLLMWRIQVRRKYSIRYSETAEGLKIWRANTGGSLLMRISLLRFFKTFHEYLPYANFGIFFSSVKIFWQNIAKK